MLRGCWAAGSQSPRCPAAGLEEASATHKSDLGSRGARAASSTSTDFSNQLQASAASRSRRGGPQRRHGLARGPRRSVRGGREAVQQAYARLRSAISRKADPIQFRWCRARAPAHGSARAIGPRAWRRSSARRDSCEIANAQTTRQADGAGRVRRLGVAMFANHVEEALLRRHAPAERTSGPMSWRTGARHHRGNWMVQPLLRIARAEACVRMLQTVRVPSSTDCFAKRRDHVAAAEVHIVELRPGPPRSPGS